MSALDNLRRDGRACGRRKMAFRTRRFPMAYNDFTMDNHWLPFTPNRQFRKDPRVFVGADGMTFTTHDGKKVIDGISSLWCVGAGHNRKPINEAIKKQLDTLDYATAFQVSNDKAFKAAEMIAAMAPGDLNKVLFCNSGSEAADTSLKVALAYHRARGEGHRNVFIGREKGYHGVGFGGMSVGGIPANRKVYGSALLPRVDHMRFIHDPVNHAYIHNQEPVWQEDILLELENRILPLHDPSNVAAIIVEPVAGSAGWYLPPQGLPEAPARDLRQARHPADLRRGDHGLRPHGDQFRRRFLRRGARHAQFRQVCHQWRDSTGRRDLPRQAVRRDDEDRGAGTRGRVLPRLHLFRPSGGVRRGHRHAEPVPRGEPVPARRRDGQGPGRCLPQHLQGHAQRDRHPQPGSGRRGGVRAGSRLAGQAGLRHLPGLLPQGFPGARGRRRGRHRAALTSWRSSTSTPWSTRWPTRSGSTPRRRRAVASLEPLPPPAPLPARSRRLPRPPRWASWCHLQPAGPAALLPSPSNCWSTSRRTASTTTPTTSWPT